MGCYRVQDSMNLHVQEIVHADGLVIGALPSDLKGVAKAAQDILMDNGKGPVVRAPNGHRMRVVISNLGVPSGFDLDAYRWLTSCRQHGRDTSGRSTRP